jgi:hypothetical protein
MTNKKHRLGVAEVNLVVRHLKLELTHADVIAQTIDEINQVYGLDNVFFDEKAHVLNLAYDATRTNIDCIEALLSNHDIQVSHDWWTHFKEGYYRFVDENIKENARHEPWNCHKTPLNIKRKP